MHAIYLVVPASWGKNIGALDGIGGQRLPLHLGDFVAHVFSHRVNVRLTCHHSATAAQFKFCNTWGNVHCACATVLGANGNVHVTPPTHVLSSNFFRLCVTTARGKREKMDREKLLLLEEAAVNVLVSYLAEKTGVERWAWDILLIFWCYSVPSQSPPFLVSSQQRKKAEAAFLELRKASHPYESCKYMLGLWIHCYYATYENSYLSKVSTTSVTINKPSCYSVKTVLVSIPHIHCNDTVTTGSQSKSV